MNGETRRSVAPFLLITTGLFLLGGCSDTSSEVAECQEMLERAVLAVDGVEAADFTCRRDFGNPGERGVVTLAAKDQGDASSSIENIYRAFAHESRIDDSWTIYVEFRSPTGKEFDAGFLEFNGDPPMYEVRERYGTRTDGG